jgi:hypothetical protein
LPWLRALVAAPFLESAAEPAPGYPDPWRQVERRLLGLRLRLLFLSHDPRLARLHRLVRDVLAARSPSADREQAQRDLIAHADVRGRLLWVGKVFNPRVVPTEAVPKPHPPSARYQAGMMSLDELGEPLRRQATQVGMDRAGRSASATEVHRQVTQYFGNHVDRMDDPSYRAEGWQIGAGPIEAACKTLVNPRLKQSGMRWGCDGADAVCHLQALYEGETGP